MLHQKKKIIETLLSEIDKKIDELKSAIEISKESRNNETKSSVGDKYETSRTIIQYEIEKLGVQLAKTQKQKDEIQRIDLQEKSKRVEFGCLVKTNIGLFFISVSWGKIDFEKNTAMCISLASPIGKMLEQKKTGENFQFHKNKITILDIF